MKKKAVFIILCIGFLLSGCQDKIRTDSIEELPVSEYVLHNTEQSSQRLYIFSDSLVLERVCSVPVTFDGSVLICTLEKWDGMNWRVLSEADALETSYAKQEGSLMEVDMTSVYQNYGDGLYRIIRSGIESGTKDKIYFANEIKVIDISFVENKDNLAALFGQKEDVTEIRLVKGNKEIFLDEQTLEELAEYVMNMKCVGLQDYSIAMGSNSEYYRMLMMLPGDVSLKIRGKSGKTLDGQEYSAIGTCTGMEQEILLYSPDKTWREFLQEKLDK